MIGTSGVGSNVAVIQDAGLSPVLLLERALEHASFWERLKFANSKVKSAATFTIAIKPDLGGCRLGTPAATSPALVEALIDAVHDRGYPSVVVTASRDSSWTFCENRDVLALAELLGYRFKTPKGREYQILEQAPDLGTKGPEPGRLLAESEVIDYWRHSQFRIIFAKNKTDETEGYALCLESLFGLLTAPDKDYFYRHRMPGPEVILEILDFAAPDFAIIDAATSLHGSGGMRAPNECKTNTIVASDDVVLADYIGALKMGLDPSVSRVFAKVTAETGLPTGYHLHGSIAAYQDWINVHPVVIDSTRRRDRWVDVSRNVRPWLQEIDPEIFPLREIVDVKGNELAVAWLRDIDSNPLAFLLLTALNYTLDALASGAYSYQVMYAKDGIRRAHVALNLRPGTFNENDYTSMQKELSEFERVLADIGPSDGIRWRYLGEAIVFEATTRVPIEFDDFTAAVDVTKTIQYMNDYLGGNCIVVEKDNVGRSIRQIERNLYLPQPNYLSFYGADPIDVTKLELAEYTRDQHRMYWKTVKSENDSARFDDGIVTFARGTGSTEISICGRQLFTLPEIVEMARLELNPRLKATLVTEAYRNFFHRTFSNLEAVAEGRDVRIGREWLDPSSAPAGEPRLAIRLEQYIRKYGDELSALLSGTVSSRPEHMESEVDENGFRHFRATGSASLGSESTLTALTKNLAIIWAELVEASQNDIRWQLSRMKATT